MKKEGGAHDEKSRRESKKASCLRSREEGALLMSHRPRPPAEAIDAGVSLVLLSTPRTSDMNKS